MKTSGGPISAPDNAVVVAIDGWDAATFDFLAQRDFDPTDATLLVAVSGGLDSMALLHFWSRHAARFRCRLIAAHVNHRLRAESDGDGDFVAAACRRLGIPLALRILDPAGKPASESLEMWGRRERYAFLADTARAHARESEAPSGPGAARVFILTAHHRDDVVETVFQRLGRGTGPLGLAGIPFRRAPEIIRPFLNRSRAEILDYARLTGLQWREDASNADLRFDRNWYRRCYLPQLRADEPDLDARVFALAMSLQGMRRGLEALEAEHALLRSDALGRPFLDRGGLDARLRDGDLEAVRFWLRALCKRIGMDYAPVTWEILHELHRQWRKNPARVQVSLARGRVLKSENTGLYCLESMGGPQSGASAGKKDGVPESKWVILDEAGGGLSWRWDDRVFTLTARRYPRPSELVFPGAAESRAIFDADSFSCTLQVRTRKAGDRFSPFGIDSRSRKLKAYFNEKKVPVAMRDIIPIVLAPCRAPLGGMDGEIVAWVPGFGISDRFKVTATTSSILELVLTCQNP